MKKDILERVKELLGRRCVRSDEMEITVYSKYDCMQCEFTKNHLKKLNVPFSEINAEENTEALKTIKDYGYLGVPVVAVGSLDNSWSGFRPDRLEELA